MTEIAVESDEQLITKMRELLGFRIRFNDYCFRLRAGQGQIYVWVRHNNVASEVVQELIKSAWFRYSPLTIRKRCYKLAERIKKEFEVD